MSLLTVKEENRRGGVKGCEEHPLVEVTKPQVRNTQLGFYSSTYTYEGICKNVDVS